MSFFQLILQFLKYLCEEGKVRENLFPGIMTSKMKKFKEEFVLKSPKLMGTKVCGAGGGGCFLVIGEDFSSLQDALDKYEMRLLPFNILPPREGIS